MNDSPLFIVGMNGSGTTMLADSLRRHPQLYVLPIESKVLPYFIATRGRFGDLASAANRRRLVDEMGRAMPYWHANGKTPLVVPEAQLADCRSFGEAVSRLYEHLAMREGKHRWGDKSPMNVHHIGAIAEQFPQARFIHIIRDGRDCAQSFHRRWGFDARHSIWRWKHAVLQGRRQGEALGAQRYLEVRYESLTADAPAQMRRICEFAGLPFDPVVLESSMRFVDPENPAAGTGRMISNSQKWRTYFDAGQLAALEDIAGKALSDLGYESAGSGDRELSAQRRRFLRLRDALVRTPYFFREYGLLRAVPRYLRHVAAARKQRAVNRY